MKLSATLRLLVLTMPLLTTPPARAQDDAEPATASMTTVTVELVTKPSEAYVPGGSRSQAAVAYVPISEYGLFDRVPDWNTFTVGSTGRADIVTTAGERILLKGSAQGFAPHYEVIRVAGLATQQPVEIQLSPGGTIRGSVVLPVEVEISSGTVTATFAHLDDERPYGRKGNMITDYTDELSTAPISADGTFRFTGVPAATILLHADVDGYVQEDYQAHVGVPPAGEASIAMKMLRTGYVAGTVRNETGAPVPNLPISRSGDF